MNPYEILDVPVDADAAAIKKAYSCAAQKTHPDRQGGGHEAFIQVRAAFDVLSDPVRREIYDTTGETDSIAVLHRQEALDNIEGLFDALIAEDGFIGDYVAEARKRVSDAVDQLRIDRRGLVASEERLSRLSGRVSSKKNNLYQKVIDRKLQAATAGVKAIDHRIEVGETIKTLLAEYADERPDPKPDMFREVWIGGPFGGGVVGRFGTAT